MVKAEEFGLKKSFELLKANGLRPRTLFDIGVATGTPGFYQTFEDVRYVLVDPLEEAEPFMRDICGRFPGAVYELAAAGAAMGEANFGVEPGLSGSSFFRKDGQKRTVPVVTLDSLVDKYQLEPPFLVKIDVQGYELEVMRGLEQHLASVEAIVTETGFWSDRKANGAVPFHELVAFMAERNFVFYDIAGLARRPRDGALAEADLVFVRKDSKLREHSSYRTPEQIAERQKEKAAKFASQKARL